MAQPPPAGIEWLTPEEKVQEDEEDLRRMGRVLEDTANQIGRAHV